MLRGEVLSEKPRIKKSTARKRTTNLYCKNSVNEAITKVKNAFNRITFSFNWRTCRISIVLKIEGFFLCEFVLIGLIFTGKNQ